MFTNSTDLDDTKHLNVGKGSDFEITLPEITELRLFVECLNEEAACSVDYETLAWQSVAEVPSKESATFVASNSVAILKAAMSPEFYNQEGDVKVTLSFYSVTSDEKPEEVELTAEDLVIKNGELNGAITKVESNVFRFVVTPVSKSSFAVILSRSLVSVNGLPLRQGMIHGCKFDDEAPYLLNTQYRSSLVDDDEEKTLVVSLNEPCVIVSYDGAVISAAMKEGYINAFDIKVRGNVSGNE